MLTRNDRLIEAEGLLSEEEPSEEELEAGLAAARAGAAWEKSRTEDPTEEVSHG